MTVTTLKDNLVPYKTAKGLYWSLLPGQTAVPEVQNGGCWNIFMESIPNVT